MKSLSLLNVALLSVLLSHVLTASAEDVPTVVAEEVIEVEVDSKEYLRPVYKGLSDGLPVELSARVTCYSNGFLDVYIGPTVQAFIRIHNTMGRGIIHDSLIREAKLTCKGVHLTIQERLYEY